MTSLMALWKGLEEEEVFRENSIKSEILSIGVCVRLAFAAINAGVRKKATICSADGCFFYETTYRTLKFVFNRAAYAIK